MRQRRVFEEFLVSQFEFLTQQRSRSFLGPTGSEEGWGDEAVPE
jgi:hypothetical protein